MPFPTIQDVKDRLGDAYSTDPPDPIIQSFLDRRIAQIKEKTGEDFTESVPESIFKWVLNTVCADVILRDLTGKDAADVLNYSLGELKENKDPNVQLKLKLYEIFMVEADKALKSYFNRTRLISYASSES